MDVVATGMDTRPTSVAMRCMGRAKVERRRVDGCTSA